jgi:hypothetical protein
MQDHEMERQGRDREVEAAQAEARQAEHESDQRACNGTGRQRDPERSRQLLEEEVVALKLARLRRDNVSRVGAEAAFGDFLVKCRQRFSALPSKLAKKTDFSRTQLTTIERGIEDELSFLANLLGKIELGDDGEDSDGERTATPLEDTAAH